MNGTFRNNDGVTKSRKTERREVLYSGRVQGVGFRYTTHSIARRFDVFGYVRNLPNGSVLLIVEGVPADIDQFLQVVEETLQRNIEGCDVQRCESTGEFDRFEIQY